MYLYTYMFFKVKSLTSEFWAMTRRLKLLEGHEATGTELSQSPPVASQRMVGLLSLSTADLD
jgi:hypothetical protein